MKENSFITLGIGIRMDKFEVAKAKAVSRLENRNGIGTLGERVLHLTMKFYFEPDEDYHEVAVGIGRYVADIANDDGIIEIQTRNFSALRAKLEAFLEAGHRVTVVHPMHATKWLSWVDPKTGETSPKRKSPKAGSLARFADELVRVRPLLGHPKLSFAVVFCDMEEYRYLNGWSHDKKRGSSRMDRVPVALREVLWFREAGDFVGLIPEGIRGSAFTSADFAKAAKCSRKLAQSALTVLREVGVIEKIGVEKRYHLYRVIKEGS